MGSTVLATWEVQVNLFAETFRTLLKVLGIKYVMHFGLKGHMYSILRCLVYINATVDNGPCGYLNLIFQSPGLK